MGFLSTLGKIAKIGQSVAPAALPVVSALNPAAGAIAGLVLNAVVKAEQSGGGGSDKKEQVMKEVLPVVGPLVSTLLASSGAKANLNSDGVTKAVSQIVDGVVALLNAVEAPASAEAGKK